MYGREMAVNWPEDAPGRDRRRVRRSGWRPLDEWGASCREAAVQGESPSVNQLPFLPDGHNSRATKSSEPPGAM